MPSHKELRETWVKWSCTMDSKQAERIANWWISKLSAREQEIREEVEDETKRHIRQKIHDIRIVKVKDGRNKTAYEIWEEVNRIVHKFLPLTENHD